MPGDKRINIRATEETVDYLKRAAALRKMSLTYFMVAVSKAMADKIMQESSTDGDPGSN